MGPSRGLRLPFCSGTASLCGQSWERELLLLSYRFSVQQTRSMNQEEERHTDPAEASESSGTPRCPSPLTLPSGETKVRSANEPRMGFPISRYLFFFVFFGVLIPFGVKPRPVVPSHEKQSSRFFSCPLLWTLSGPCLDLHGLV